MNITDWNLLFAHRFWVFFNRNQCSVYSNETWIKTIYESLPFPRNILHRRENQSHEFSIQKPKKKIPHKIILQQKEEKKLHDLAYAAWYTDYNSQKKVSKSHISIFIFPFFFLQFSSENVLAQNLKILIWNNKKKSDKKYGNCVWAEPSQLMRVSKCSRSFHFFNKIFKRKSFWFFNEK